MTKIEECKQLLENAEKYKNRCTEYEQKIEMLNETNRKLGIRAAVSFDELTPRYQRFPEVFAEIGIPLPKPDYKFGANISTNSYIESMITWYKQSASPKRKFSIQHDISTNLNNSNTKQ